MKVNIQRASEFDDYGKLLYCAKDDPCIVSVQQWKSVITAYFWTVSWITLF